MNDDACRGFRERLTAYIYGELADTTDFEHHLADCPACRQELEATRHALAMVDRAGLDDAPDGIADAVVSGVLSKLRPTPKRPATRWLNRVAAVAACLLVGTIGTWIFVRTSGSDPATNSGRGLGLAARAVSAEGQSVLRLLDELEAEDDILVQLLGEKETEQPHIDPNRDQKGEESA